MLEVVINVVTNCKNFVLGPESSQLTALVNSPQFFNVLEDVSQESEHSEN
jgi:hypothetical protein